MNKKIIAAFLTVSIFLNVAAQSPQLFGLTSLGASDNTGSVIHINGDSSGFYDIAFNAFEGAYPGGHLVLGKNNLFYGMTFSGGAYNLGTIFSFNPVDSMYSDLYDIDSTGTYNTFSNLTPAGDSIIYGILYDGGILQQGSLFSFNYLSHVYNTLFEVTDISKGANPRDMTLAENNVLYGVTDSGGLYGYGTIFSFNPNTGIYNDVYDFDSAIYSPCGGLVQANNGLLYGLTGEGGANNYGVIYSFDTAGNVFIKRYDFAFSDGLPYWNNAMIMATNNFLYGMAENGGDNNWGTIFSFNPANDTFSKLYDLDSVNGKWPSSRLMQASDGKLYGMTTWGGMYNPIDDGDGVIFSFDYTDTSYVKLKDLSMTTGYNPYGDLTEYPFPAAIKQISNVYPLVIYPNPTGSLVNLQIPAAVLNNNDGGTVVISNTLGQTITKQPVNKTLMPFDVSTLSPGVYYVILINGVSTWQGKFVKE
jgi:uncharacterized repeat protein (TIGR03803 family)